MITLRVLMAIGSRVVWLLMMADDDSEDANDDGISNGLAVVRGR